MPVAERALPRLPILALSLMPTEPPNSAVGRDYALVEEDDFGYTGASNVLERFEHPHSNLQRRSGKEKGENRMPCHGLSFQIVAGNAQLRALR